MPPDPTTAAELLLSGAAVRTLLGPAAGELAEGLRRSTEYRLRNFGRVTAKAEAKLGARIDDDGSVHPRVAQKILDDGSWCDDDLTHEYLGGILAASRQPGQPDDRGLTWATAVTSLSSYEVRTHYLIYSSMRRLGRERPGGPPPVGLHEERQAHRVFLPFESYGAAIGQPESVAAGIALHAVLGLRRVGLLGWTYGVPGISGRFPGAEGLGGIDASIETPGAELFLWAHGIQMTHHSQLFSAPDEHFKIEDEAIVVPDALIC